MELNGIQYTWKRYARKRIVFYARGGYAQGSQPLASVHKIDNPTFFTIIFVI